MITPTHRALGLVLAVALLTACSTTPPTAEQRDELLQRAQADLAEWKKADPGLDAVIQGRYGYVFFPEVTKAGCCAICSTSPRSSLPRRRRCARQLKLPGPPRNRCLASVAHGSKSRSSSSRHRAPGARCSLKHSP